MNAVSRPMPLDGVRVLDLGQFIAMPFCASVCLLGAGSHRCGVAPS